MKKLMFVPLVVLALALTVNIPVSLAQETNNEDKFSFGKVVSVNAQEVMVKEYDFAKDADVEVAYSITADTELGNVNVITDLAVSDDIVIDYVEKDGKRVVTTLVKEDKGAEAPAAPLEGDAVPAGEPAAEQVPAAVVPADAAVLDAPVAASVPVVEAQK